MLGFTTFVIMFDAASHSNLFSSYHGKFRHRLDVLCVLTKVPESERDVFIRYGTEDALEHTKLPAKGPLEPKASGNTFEKLIKS